MKKRVFVLNILNIVIILFLISISLISNICIAQNVTENNKTNETFPELNPSIEFSWNDEDIINGKEFDIKVSAFDLSNAKYDVKVYIYRDENENRILSETYHRTEWVYSSVAVPGFFIGPGNKTKDVSLRILESYRSFNKSAKIKLVMKKAYSSDVKLELEDVIKILPQRTDKAQESALTENKDLTDSEPETPSITGEVIKIGSSTSNSNTITSSQNNFFKYFIFGFIILIIIFLIIFIIRTFK
ncbi:MAG: hypothetical protein AABX54_02150 [Nanoarchaeota archaeon]